MQMFLQLFILITHMLFLKPKPKNNNEPKANKKNNQSITNM